MSFFDNNNNSPHILIGSVPCTLLNNLLYLWIVKELSDIYMMIVPSSKMENVLG